MQSARLILPEIPLFKKVSEKTYRATGLLLPFLLEQLIVNGASKIVITSPWRYEDSLSDLPKIYRHYIILSHEKTRARLLTKEILDPIYDEIGIVTDGGGVFRLRHGTSGDDPGIQDAMCLSGNLEEFFTALFCRAQFHSRIEEILSRLDRLFRQICDESGRAHLACLIPVFRSYKKLDVAGAQVIAATDTELVDRLADVIQSMEFQNLPESRYSLGIGKSIQIVASEIRHRMKALLDIKAAKSTIDFLSKTVSATAGIPVPNSELAQSFLTERFLPPALDLSQQIADAQARFFQQNPDWGR